MWNNTCVLIDNDGNIILSKSYLGRHNEAISECASQIGISLSKNEPMPVMLEALTKKDNVVLLNCGKVKNEENIEKRTGYLALPDKINKNQLVAIEALKLLLDDYQALTVWQLDNNKLKTKSMGNANFAALLLQEMSNDAVINEKIKKCP